jgi:hypothetical protein
MMIGDTAEKKKKVTRNWTKNITREKPGRKKKAQSWISSNRRGQATEEGR